jgi:hypothetical protein
VEARTSPSGEARLFALSDAEWALVRPMIGPERDFVRAFHRLPVASAAEGFAAEEHRAPLFCGGAVTPRLSVPHVAHIIRTVVRRIEIDDTRIHHQMVQRDQDHQSKQPIFGNVAQALVLAHLA